MSTGFRFFKGEVVGGGNEDRRLRRDLFTHRAAENAIRPRWIYCDTEHETGSPANRFFQKVAEPDKRAGTVSKTDRCAPRRMGSMPSGYRRFSSAGLAEQPCTRLVNETRRERHP